MNRDPYAAVQGGKHLDEPSRVKRPRSALRILEKSAAANPVRLAALRTVKERLSSTAMIRAARMALACFSSA